MFSEAIDNLSKDINTNFNENSLTAEYNKIYGSKIDYEEVDALKELNTKILQEINEIAITIDKLTSLDFRFMSASEAKATLSPTFPDILIRQIRKAIKVRREYDYPPFRGRLIEAARLPDLFIVRVNYDGSFFVSLAMQEKFGRLEEYANAVEAVRKKNAGNPDIPKAFQDSTPSAALRSKFWAEKFYAVAREDAPLFTSGGKERPDKAGLYKLKYIQTIEDRLQGCINLAPFWELLDKGGVEMSSDIGGTAYPSTEPGTKFVDGTIVKIKDILNEEAKLNLTKFTALRDAKLISAKEYSRLLYEWISKIRTRINQIYDDLRRREQGREKIQGPSYESKSSRIARIETAQEFERLEAKGKPFDRVKVERIITDLANGVDIETRTRGRVGIGHGERMATITLARRIRKALE